MTQADSKISSVSDNTQFSTERASRYLQQLCKHFGHKVPAEFDAHSGAITFPFGQCALKASDNVLDITITTANDDDLARLADVIERHLARFAFREQGTLNWSSGRSVALTTD